MKTLNSVPSTVATVLGVAAALVIAFGHLGPVGSALVTSLATALGTLLVVIIGAVNGKPVSLQVLTGAAMVIFSDLALFGIRMSADERGALAAAVGVFAGLALHLLHVTVTAAPAPPHRAERS